MQKLNYKPHDKYFVVNDNDVDLIPIYISLPDPPDLKLIDGYGKNPDDQFWVRPKTPQKLISLEEQVKRDLEIWEKSAANNKITGQKIIDEIYKRIEDNFDYYAQEVEWIKKQWWHIINGYWFYCDGKPTYIDGWHYAYLSFWYILQNKGYPEYRDVDRRNFLFHRYATTCTETFKNLDANGNAVPDENGNYETIDLGYRVSYGDVQPKNRRRGATNQVLNCMYIETIIHQGFDSGILSMDKDNAEDHFRNKLVPAWQRMPFFLRPNWDGFNDPASELKFNLPKNKVTGKELRSTFKYSESARGSTWDGSPFGSLVFDESGKTTLCDVTERWEQLKHCLSLGEGAEIKGVAFHPSTVEDMDVGGGTAYYNLTLNSSFYRRISNTGQTISGLFRLFFPAYDGLHGFIDKFGASIIDEPTERQKKLGFNKKIGAKAWVMSKRDSLLKDGSPRAMKEYRQLIMKFPIKMEECFRVNSGNLGFDYEKLDSRIAELRRGNTKLLRGNFEWERGFGSRVIWVDDNLNGRFYISEILPESRSNLNVLYTDIDQVTFQEIVVKKPLYGSEYTACGDVFDFTTKSEAKIISDGTRMSDGGFAIFKERNKHQDSGDNMSDWNSYRFVCTYRERPSLNDFCEDCLKACIYYGAMLFPETNKKGLLQKFVEWGYSGYLLYDIDPLTGRKKDNPGFFTFDGLKDDIFAYLKDYIDYRSHKEVHLNLLQELKDIRGQEEMTKYDLLTAAGGCLVGSRSRYRELIDGVDDININLDDFSAYLR